MLATKVKISIQDAVKSALNKFDYYDPSMVEVKLEQPKQNEHGDLSCNIAMLLPAFARKAPRKIAEEILNNLTTIEFVEKIEIAGPGFINFYLSWDYYHQLLKEIVEVGVNYGKSELGKGVKVQFEFVSANPTGPLNIVSARAAAIGDVLANLFNYIGFQADREYYINDAGRQIRLLGQSVSSHYMKYFNADEDFPEDGYHGEYIKDLAHNIAEQIGNALVDVDQNERHQKLAKIALNHMVESHKRMMKKYRVEYQNWFSEQSLRDSKLYESILDILKAKNCIYEDSGAVWFRATQFGDDKDRVLITSEGQPTYFLIDVAYHKNKYDRGYKILYNFLGPDHHGYIPRMKAALKALGYDENTFNAEIIQQVNLYRGGEVVKMSKRAGQIIEMEELVDEVGIDAARFFFINRKMTSHLDFDIDLAKKQSEDNPVFYLQYAHARICSILKYADDQGVNMSDNPDLELINSPEEKGLLKQLENFSDVIEKSALCLEPHLLTNYLRDLAALLHHFYHIHRVVTDDIKLSQARLYLVFAAKIVFSNGLKLLGINAPERM